MIEPRRVSEGVLLASATFVGYGLAFAHEAGYAGYFGVPPDLVSVDIIRVLVALAAVLALFGCCLFYYNTVSEFLASFKWPKPVTDRLSPLAGALIVLLVSSRFYALPRISVLALAGMLILLGLVAFVLPLATERKTRGYLAKLVASNLAAGSAGNGTTSDSSPLGTFIQLVGRSAFQMMFYLAVVLFIAFGIGRGEAARREWFQCSADSLATVLVRTYGATTIGARYDPATHRLTGTLSVGTRGEGPWSTLAWRKVGRLQSIMSGENGHPVEQR